MKKPRKRRAKARRQRNPGRTPGRTQVDLKIPATSCKTGHGVGPFKYLAQLRLDLDDERQAFAMLMAPFFIMAFAIAMDVSIQTKFQISHFAPELLVASEELSDKLVFSDVKPVSVVEPDRFDNEVAVGAVVSGQRVRDFRVVETFRPILAGEKVSQVVALEEHEGRVLRPADIYDAGVHHVASGERIEHSLNFEGEVSVQFSSVLKQSGVYDRNVVIPRKDAVLLSPIETAQMVRSGVAISALALTVLIDGDVRDISPDQLMCVADANAFQHVHEPAKPMSFLKEPTGFGVALARAARRQTSDFVIYNDKYMSIGFPMGDVPTLYGVCTDVVIRAYRSLGLDLQNLVYRSRIGRGDRSINHRRTQTLKIFFRRFGLSLAITQNPEDYLPGDIVTYHRPQNRGSQMHIGIVADVIAPSGRPMLIHNRGWGPQMEDALFVDKITGHFRYHGPKQVLPQTVASGRAFEQVLDSRKR